MAMEMKQSLKMSQQLVMTPQLQQAIKLLQLNHLELAEHISQEMVENPVLEEQAEVFTREEQEEGVSSERKGAPEVDPGGGEAGDPRDNAFDWKQIVESEYAPGQHQSLGPTFADDLPPPETNLTRESSLVEHLHWQLHLVTAEEEVAQAAALIAGELDDDGYLHISLEDIAVDTGTPLAVLVEGLALLQTLDPLGVGARDLRECLLIQASTNFPHDTILAGIIDRHLPDLERKNYAAIAKDLGVSIPRVVEGLKIITMMEPRPGRAFTGEAAPYITPDVYVQKVGDRYVVQLNEDGLPKLRVSPYYRSVLSGMVKGDKEYVQERLRSALWLIKSIHQRQRTIHKVVGSIVEKQQEFFEKGVASLRPMILRDIADDIGMHESTISRVTTNKYVHTPQGIFELKYFFNSAINRSGGEEDIASEAVKQKIKKMIADENPRKPHSDEDLVRLLHQNEGIDIARRTVAKYREVMNIESSTRRRRGY